MMPTDLIKSLGNDETAIISYIFRDDTAQIESFTRHIIVKNGVTAEYLLHKLRTEFEIQINMVKNKNIVNTTEVFTQRILFVNPRELYRSLNMVAIMNETRKYEPSSFSYLPRTFIWKSGLITRYNEPLYNATRHV